jgi:hypothetical protein
MSVVQSLRICVPEKTIQSVPDDLVNLRGMARDDLGGGVGIHWEAIDEDISVAGLLQPERFMAGPTAQLPGRGRRKAKSRKAAPAIRG